MEYLKKLNKNQKEAVISEEKYLRIVAGAGSGKTRVLTSRIIHLIKEGVRPYNILAITFTNKAANEMRERVLNTLENLDSKPYIFTFHSFCARFLREESKLINYNSDFNIIDDEDKQRLLKEIVKEKNFHKDYLEVKTLSNYISYRKTYYYNRKFTISSGFSEELEKDKNDVFEIYERRLKRMNSVDFDDLLLKVYKILVQHKETLTKWQNRYRHILVDEFQDTNDLQFELVKLLVGEQNHLFVVGDPDQTIYTWRGANIKIIADLEKTYEGTKTIVLDRNYRSTKPILDVANKLIKNNQNRVHKDLISDKEGDDVFYRSFETQFHEASYVVGTIKGIVSEGEYQYKDFAILYRANYLSREVEKALIKENVKYKIFGGVGFYNRKEIKDAIAYLKLLVNKSDDLSLLRIINEPRRGVGEATLNKFISKSNKEEMSLFKAISNNLDYISRIAARNQIAKFIQIINEYTDHVDKLSPGELLDNLLRETKYYEKLEQDEEHERIDNLKELINDLVYFENNNEDPKLTNFLQEITLYSSQDEIEDGNYVSLMTVHTAKGLEYPFVFVVGLCDGIFPSYRSLKESEDGEEEERRLAYVAFTRAKERLFLSSNRGFSYVSAEGRNKPSRFIKEVIDLEVAKPRKIIRDERPKRTFKSISPINKANNIKWSNGDQVNHANFGFGVIIEIINDTYIKVAFKDSGVGIKTLLSNHGSITKV